MTTSPELASDREIVLSRVFDAPRALVFAAWTDPQQVGRWLGPRGFTTTTASIDVRPGGEWHFTLNGPDGTKYPNVITYVEITPPERIVYAHGTGAPNDPSQFEVTVIFAEQGQQTALTMRMRFKSAAALQRVVEKYHAIEGAHQTLDRLAEHLAVRGS
jgi:uncharacterized protein YndB with AHSA1/START domain